MSQQVQGYLQWHPSEPEPEPGPEEGVTSAVNSVPSVES
jgi:hypothetical protein